MLSSARSRLTRHPAATTTLQPISSTQQSPFSRLFHSYYADRELAPPERAEHFRPIFQRQQKFAGADDVRPKLKQDVSELRRRLRKGDLTWAVECEPRLGQTGLKDKASERTPIDYVRGTCVWACTARVAPSEEIAARILCAATQDSRYFEIYHSVDRQAHTLYLLGRLELEREESVWRQVAWYMLSISAGLGHLDAALLLHQLHKVDPKYSPGAEAREIIAGAAEQQLDWRAMVAHCEDVLARAKSRHTADKTGNPEVEQCLSILAKAMELTGPMSEAEEIRETPPAGRLDATTLETFAPPYKLILELTADHVLASTASDQMLHYFQLAAEAGALEYHDARAAWLYAQWAATTGNAYSSKWVRFAEIAASDGNPEAAFALAKHYLHQDAWYPSLTAKVLADARQRDAESYRLSDIADEVPTVTDSEKHNEIMALKRDLPLRGLLWMQTSAELQLDNPVKAVNRYFIVAGLYRQNAFLDEGRNTLLEAQRKLQDSVGGPRMRAAALAKTAEYLQHWDSRLVHKLLDPDQVDPLLNPPRTTSPA